MIAESHLVLVGAGHTHLHLLRHAGELRAHGYRITLVSPRWFDYSGTASSVATGSRPPTVGRIDVGALAQGEVEHRPGRAVSVDPVRRIVVTAAGEEIAYDVVSLNLGSVARVPAGIDVDESVIRIKPLDELSRLDARLEERRGSAGGTRATVVGGGASGVELAAHLAVRPDVGIVRLLQQGSRLTPGLPERAARRLRVLLERRGVEVRTGVRVTEIARERVELAGDAPVAHDVAVLATGLAPPPLATQPPLGGPDGIPVRATLQHADHDDVHAVGDCADFLPGSLPRIGVHGVRQGPVMLAALVARRAGDPAPRYEPQAHALSILDLADTGLAARGLWWWEGRAALRLKRRIDRRWVAAHQR